MDTSRLDKYDKDICGAYEEIARYKWDNNFACRKCENTKYFEGKTPFSRRCSKCKTDESATAATVFDKLRIPLPIALDIIKQIVESDTWLKSVVLTKALEEKWNLKLRQQTIWAFLDRIYNALGREEISYDNEALYITFRSKSNRVVVSKGVSMGIVRYQAHYDDIPVNDSEALFSEVNTIINQYTEPGTKIVAYNLSLLKSKNLKSNRLHLSGIIVKNRPKLVTNEETRLKYLNDSIAFAKDVFPWVAGEHFNLYFFKRENNTYDSLLNTLTRYYIKNETAKPE